MLRPTKDGILARRPMVTVGGCRWIVGLGLLILVGQSWASGQAATAAQSSVPEEVQATEPAAAAPGPQSAEGADSGVGSELSGSDRLERAKQCTTRAARALEENRPFDALRELHVAWNLTPDGHPRKAIYEGVMLDVADRAAAFFPLAHAAETSPVSSVLGEARLGRDAVTVRIQHAAPCFEFRKTLPRSRLLHLNRPGRYVLTQAESDVLMLWSTDGNEVEGHALRVGSQPRFARFTESGNRVIACTEDQKVQLWDVESRAAVDLPLEHTSPLRQVTLSDPGFWLLLVRMDGTVEVWNPDTSQRLASTQLKPRDSEASADYFASPTDRKTRFDAVVNARHDRVILQAGNGRVGLWDLSTGASIGDWLSDSLGIRAAYFSRDSDTLAVTFSDGSVRTLDARNGRWQGVTLQEHPPVRFSFFAAADKRLATVNAEGVKLWDLDAEHRSAWFGTAFSTNSAFSMHVGLGIACTSDPVGSAWTWDLATGKMTAGPMNHASRLLNITIDDDSRHLTTLTRTGAFHLWDTLTGLPLGDPFQLSELPREFHLSRDVQVLAAECGDGYVRIAKTRPRVRAESPQQVLEFLARQTVDPSGKARPLDEAEVAQRLHLLRERKEPWLAGLGDRNLQRVTAIALESQPALAAEVLRLLPGTRSLEVLRLSNSPVATREAYETVAGVSSLHTLALDATTFDDMACNYLRDLPALEVLDLRDTQVSDAGLATIAQIASLRRLCLDGLRVSTAGLEELARLGDLQELQLARTSIDDRSLEALRAMSQLKTLDVARTSITDVALEPLLSLERLTVLDLRGTQVTVSGLEQLLERLPLERVYLHESRVTTQDIASLKDRFPNCVLDGETPRP